MPGLTNDGRILDGRTFWLRAHSFQDLSDATVVVIGSGETAATVVVELVKRVSRLTSIVVVNRQGTIFSRGESYDENKLYSNPDKWRRIDIVQRREFLRRTDRGVFSVNAKRVLNSAGNVKHYSLDVAQIRSTRTRKLALLGKSKRFKPLECDYVVNATSFDSFWFRRLFPTDLRHQLMDDRRVEANISDDLSIKGIRPKLHAPMLAGLEQGPGFPNLTCLGLLSDRILGPYLQPFAG